MCSEFKAGVLPPLEGNNKRRKTNTNPIFMYVQYEIKHFCWKLKILKIADNLTKDKMQATKGR